MKMPAKKLAEWFSLNKRDLPWRADRDPYRIWISETMLQQTTTTAVIPFFERFLKQFPDLKTLAEAPEAKVIEAWAGLGYYSRARNLHKAAKQLAALPRFPQDYQQLIELPGFGPYTARAVASLAFGQSVGVVDGNVIRVLSRYHAEAWEWWNGKTRNAIQKIADEWAAQAPSTDVNQGLMELGRTICTPKSPTCLLCPLRSGCKALSRGRTHDWPLAKPRRAREVWCWEPEVTLKNGKLRLIRNESLPFLKGQWLLPGRGEKRKDQPKKFDYRHSITHHDIFVTVKTGTPKIKGTERWIPLEEIGQHVPTSLVVKALRVAEPKLADPQRVRGKKENRLGHSDERQRVGRRDGGRGRQ